MKHRNALSVREISSKTQVKQKQENEIHKLGWFNIMMNSIEKKNEFFQRNTTHITNNWIIRAAKIMIKLRTEN